MECFDIMWQFRFVFKCDFLHVFLLSLNYMKDLFCFGKKKYNFQMKHKVSKIFVLSIKRWISMCAETIHLLTHLSISRRINWESIEPSSYLSQQIMVLRCDDFQLLFYKLSILIGQHKIPTALGNIAFFIIILHFIDCTTQPGFHWSPASFSSNIWLIFYYWVTNWKEKGGLRRTTR